MLDQSTRTTILKLHRQGVKKRRIARLLQLSRTTVRKVITSQSETPPPMRRPEKAEAYREQILELHPRCKGNLVRVHEELRALGAEISYPALTAFCRRHGIGHKPVQPVGSYRFEPGQEMQHDTSPHQVEIGGKRRRVQTAAGVLAYSRMLFFQCYARFQRFECKLFLYDALEFFGGAPEVIMIDNTHVVVLHGTGASMVPVPEMEAFAERYGTRFRAHAIGNANRSARVERPFHYIENNFFAGRTFDDFHQLNEAARAWCERVNGRYKRHLKARPSELFAVESAHLRPLPVWVPAPCRIHHRIIDVNGYVTVHTNRYSVPVDWIGRQVQVREMKQSLEITLGRDTVSHPRVIEPVGQWVTCAEHRPARRCPRRGPPPEQATLLERAPELGPYVAQLSKRRRKPLVLALRQLLRMVREYPRQPLVEAVREADHYGLYDLDRLESMVLRRIGRDFFPYGGDDD